MKRMSRKTAMIILVTTLVLLTVALIAQIVAEGEFNSTIAVRTLIPMGLCVSSIIKVGTIGGTRGRKFFEKLYEKEIGEAFSAGDRRGEKNKLLDGIKAYHESRYDVAIGILEGLLPRCRDVADATATRLFLGLTYTDMGLSEKAIETYEKLLEQNAACANAWNNLGLQYAKKGLSDKAAHCYRRATECDESYAVAFNNMAQLLIQQSRWAEAIPFAGHALFLRKDLTPAANALAISYYALGKKEESRRYADMAVMNGSDRKSLETAFALLDRGVSPVTPQVRLTPEVETAMDLFRRATVRPMLGVCLPAEGVNRGRSRVGGESIGDVPTDSRGYPMRMLAAIWCSEARGVPDMPAAGILRFFIADDRYYGCDRHRPTEQSDFRVLYTEDEEAFGECLAETVLPAGAGENFPVKGCYPIYFQPGMGTCLVADHRFKPALNQALQKAGAPSVEEMDPAMYGAICEQNTWGGHRIGGYPCFEQIDPRPEKGLERYDTLLFQLVSHSQSPNGDCDLIEFGREGGCQFLIPAEKLRNKDFSDVLYWWDDLSAD
jgi:uncharacterized protein YwqG